MKYDQQKLHRTPLELSVKEMLESFNMFKGRYQPHSQFWFVSGFYPSKNSVIHSWAKSRGIIRHNYVHLWWSGAYNGALENQQDKTLAPLLLIGGGVVQINDAYFSY